MIYVMGRQSPASQEEETVPQITKIGILPLLSPGVNLEFIF